MSNESSKISEPNGTKPFVMGWLELDKQKPEHGQRCAWYSTDDKSRVWISRYVDHYMSHVSQMIRWCPLPAIP